MRKLGSPYHRDPKSWPTKTGTRLMQIEKLKIRDKGQTYFYIPYLLNGTFHLITFLATLLNAF